MDYLFSRLESFKVKLANLFFRVRNNQRHFWLDQIGRIRVHFFKLFE